MALQLAAAHDGDMCVDDAIRMVKEGLFGILFITNRQGGDHNLPLLIIGNKPLNSWNSD